MFRCGRGGNGSLVVGLGELGQVLRQRRRFFRRHHGFGEDAAHGCHIVSAVEAVFQYGFGQLFGKADEGVCFLRVAAVIGRFVFGDEAVVAESQPVEAAVEREVFVDFVDGFAVFGVKRRQAFDGAGGRFARARVGQVFVTATQVERQHRHPCPDFRVGAGADLPCDLAEQIGFEREVAVGEIGGVGGAVFVFVRYRLQVHSVCTQLEHPLDEFVVVFVLLHGVGMVQFVEFDIDGALVRQLEPFARQIRLQALQRGFLIGKHTADALFADWVECFVGQGQVALETDVAGNIDRSQGKLAIRPYQHFGFDTGAAGNGVTRRFQIVVDALAVLFGGFVTAVLVMAGKDGGKLRSAGIALDAVVQVVGVRGDFNQPACLHFAHLFPCDEGGTRQAGGIVILDAAAGGYFQPRGNQRIDGGVVEGF